MAKNKVDPNPYENVDARNQSSAYIVDAPVPNCTIANENDSIAGLLPQNTCNSFDYSRTDSS